MKIEDIETADQFVRFMEMIWEMDMTSDGETVWLHQHRLYPLYNDANKVAKILGLSRSGSGIAEGKTTYVYRFPRGDGVVINQTGSSIKLARRPVKA